MLSLLGSLLGFGTSFLPKIMDYFQDKADKKHELAVIDKQIEANKHLHTQKIELANVDADIRQIEALHKEHTEVTGKASRWVVNLSASVRPVITYAIFLEFVLLTVMVYCGVIDAGDYEMIWSEEMEAVWAAVLSFWFGSRTFNRRGGHL